MSLVYRISTTEGKFNEQWPVIFPLGNVGISCVSPSMVGQSVPLKQCSEEQHGADNHRQHQRQYAQDWIFKACLNITEVINIEICACLSAVCLPVSPLSSWFVPFSIHTRQNFNIMHYVDKMPFFIQCNCFIVSLDFTLTHTVSTATNSKTGHRRISSGVFE